MNIFLNCLWGGIKKYLNDNAGRNDLFFNLNFSAINFFIKLIIPIAIFYLIAGEYPGLVLAKEKLFTLGSLNKKAFKKTSIPNSHSQLTNNNLNALYHHTMQRINNFRQSLASPVNNLYNSYQPLRNYASYNNYYHPFSYSVNNSSILNRPINLGNSSLNLNSLNRTAFNQLQPSYNPASYSVNNSSSHIQSISTLPQPMPFTLNSLNNIVFNNHITPQPITNYNNVSHPYDLTSLFSRTREKIYNFREELKQPQKISLSDLYNKAIGRLKIYNDSHTFPNRYLNGYPQEGKSLFVKTDFNLSSMNKAFGSLPYQNTSTPFVGAGGYRPRVKEKVIGNEKLRIEDYPDRRVTYYYDLETNKLIWQDVAYRKGIEGDNKVTLYNQGAPTSETTFYSNGTFAQTKYNPVYTPEGELLRYTAGKNTKLPDGSVLSQPTDMVKVKGSTADFFVPQDRIKFKLGWFDLKRNWPEVELADGKKVFIPKELYPAKLNSGADKPWYTKLGNGLNAMGASIKDGVLGLGAKIKRPFVGNKETIDIDDEFATWAELGVTPEELNPSFDTTFKPTGALAYYKGGPEQYVKDLRRQLGIDKPWYTKVGDAVASLFKKGNKPQPATWGDLGVEPYIPTIELAKEYLDRKPAHFGPEGETAPKEIPVETNPPTSVAEGTPGHTPGIGDSVMDFIFGGSSADAGELPEASKRQKQQSFTPPTEEIKQPSTAGSSADSTGKEDIGEGKAEKPLPETTAPPPISELEVAAKKLDELVREMQNFTKGFKIPTLPSSQPKSAQEGQQRYLAPTTTEHLIVQRDGSFYIGDTPYPDLAAAEKALTAREYTVQFADGSTVNYIDGQATGIGKVLRREQVAAKGGEAEGVGVDTKLVRSKDTTKIEDLINTISTDPEGLGDWYYADGVDVDVGKLTDKIRSLGKAEVIHQLKELQWKSDLLKRDSYTRQRMESVKASVKKPPTPDSKLRKDITKIVNDLGLGDYLDLGKATKAVGKVSERPGSGITPGDSGGKKPGGASIEHPGIIREKEPSKEPHVTGNPDEGTSTIGASKKEEPSIPVKEKGHSPDIPPDIGYIEIEVSPTQPQILSIEEVKIGDDQRIGDGQPEIGLKSVSGLFDDIEKIAGGTTDFHSE